MQQSPQTLPVKPPVTEESLQGMLAELRRNIAADIGQFREEVNGFQARFRNSEHTTEAHETRIATLKQSLTKLHHSQTRSEEHMAALEDKRRWKNVKVRSLPDTMEMAEFPHFIRRLLTKLFFAKQAKAMTLAGWHRITGPAKGIQRPTRDIILRFQQGQDRTAFMAAVRHITPLRFEDHDLSCYPDLSKATMEWRRSLRPLTQALAASKTPYKWGSPRCLLITWETGMVKVREASEIPSILLQMGVTATAAETATQTALTSWDPERVTPFIPAAHRGSPATKQVR
ncbi:Hypothetical predicted protein [Pelobates cultripes]|uniref:Uncharacterized protein n=1 Tax=Pelobates cultripes TaxID=61616 RepID=A0AAD1T0B6_PELCU|nr:Hypothetical predicted protein [Pelobates cultripes]